MARYPFFHLAINWLARLRVERLLLVLHPQDVSRRLTSAERGGSHGKPGCFPARPHGFCRLSPNPY